MTVIVNASALEAVFSGMQTRIIAATAEGVAAGARVFEEAIKDELRGSHAKGTPTGSTPGTPPESVSGRLRGSVSMTKTRRYGLRIEAEVGPREFYGRFQERGTKKMEARPFIKPAVEKSEARVEAEIIGAWRRALL